MFRLACHQALWVVSLLLLSVSWSEAGWIPQSHRTLNRWNATASLGLSSSLFGTDASRRLDRSGYGEEVVRCEGVWPFYFCETVKKYPEQRHTTPVGLSITGNARLTSKTSAGVLIGLPSRVGEVWGRDDNDGAIQVEGGLQTFALLYGYDHTQRLRIGPSINRVTLELHGDSRNRFEETRWGAVVEYGRGWLRERMSLELSMQLRGVFGSGFDRVPSTGGTGTLDPRDIGFSSFVVGFQVGYGR
jgi:hypothetical protein